MIYKNKINTRQYLFIPSTRISIVAHSCIVCIDKYNIYTRARYNTLILSCEYIYLSRIVNRNQ